MKEKTQKGESKGRKEAQRKCKIKEMRCWKVK